MALDFPPASAGSYVDPVSGLKYIYNTGVNAWEAAIQPPAVISPDVPSITIPGFLWWDSTNGSLYIYYSDEGDSGSGIEASSQWVEAAPTGAASSIAQIGINPPLNPNDGELWWCTETGNLYIYYVDIDGGQWVQAGVSASTIATLVGTRASSGMTAPTAARSNDLWYNTEDKTLYINYKTGNTPNWPSQLQGHMNLGPNSMRALRVLIHLFLLTLFACRPQSDPPARKPLSPL